jgi:invasion protein IalB
MMEARPMGSSHRAAAVIALAVLVAAPDSPARSQARPPAPAPATASTPASSSPERTTASYGDWTLRCEAHAGAPAKTCEVAQAILDAQGQAVAQLVLARPAARPPAAGLVGVVQVPLNATVAEPVRLTFEASGPAVLSLPFRACAPRGCFAEGALPDQEFQQLRRRAEPARLEYRDAAANGVVRPVSLRGLSAALDALERETR